MLIRKKKKTFFFLGGGIAAAQSALPTEKLEDVYRVGQTVKCRVVFIHKETRRLSLSMKVFFVVVLHAFECENCFLLVFFLIIQIFWVVAQ